MKNTNNNARSAAPGLSGIAIAPVAAPEDRRPDGPSASRRAGGALLVRIVRHEWRSLAADRTLWLIVALFAGLVGYALYNGVSWVQFQERNLSTVVAEDAARITDLQERVERIATGAEEAPSAFRDPRRPSAVGQNLGRQHAVLPPTPLAALSVGQSDLHPYYVPVSTRSRDTFGAGDEIENPVHLLAGRFDLAFVIVFLLPLLILALSYNLLSQEREGGTLALVLSQPVRLGRVVAGKVLARFGLVLGLVVGFTLLGLLVGGVELTAPGVAARLGLWVGVVALYGAFWFGLAIAVNALGRGSATNAVALASLWLLFVILVPSALNAAASTFYPVPSRVEMIGATREASRQATEEGSTLLARYYEDHPELMPDGEASLSDFAVISYTVQEAVEERMQPVRERFEGQIARQQELVERFRYLSPAILTQGAINDIAGSGDARQRHFSEQVDRFHAEWRDFFGPRIYRQVLLTPADLDQMPRWHFQEETTADVSGRTGVAAAGLLALLLLVGGFGGWALRRYPRTG